MIMQLKRKNIGIRHKDVVLNECYIHRSYGLGFVHTMRYDEFLFNMHKDQIYIRHMKYSKWKQRYELPMTRLYFKLRK